MRDAERDVRDLLDRMGDEAGNPGPLPGPVRRRVVVRRAAVAVGSACLGVLLVVGGVTAASSVFPTGDRARPGLQTAAGEDERKPEEMKGDLVATGTSEGIRWWLTAYLESGSDLCTELATENADGTGGGSGSGCGRYNPDRYPIGLGVQSGDGLSIASGHVPDRTERLELVLEGDERISLELLDAPDDFPLPVRFYVLAPFPADKAEVFVAYDAAGDEIGRQETFGPDDRSKTEKIAGPFVIDESEHDGIPFVLRGRVERQETPRGDTWVYPCTMFMLGKDEQYGGGGSCHIPLARNHQVNFSQGSFQGQSVVAIHGAATEKADRVAIELTSGEVIDAQMFEVEDVGFRFFLVLTELPREDLVGQVVAYDGANELDRVDLCDPEMTPPGSACGP